MAVFITSLRVLIVPLWNWNRTIRIDKNRKLRFNRTFMELKSEDIDFLRYPFQF